MAEESSSSKAPVKIEKHYITINAAVYNQGGHGTTHVVDSNMAIGGSHVTEHQDCSASPPISVQNKTETAPYDQSKIGLAEEPKLKSPTLTISDPKMDGLERLISNPKTRPPKRDYVESNAKLSGLKNDSPEGKYSELDDSSPRGKFKTTDLNIKTNVTKFNEPETKLTESKPEISDPKQKIANREPKMTALKSKTEINNLELEIDNQKKDAINPPIIGELKVIDKDKAMKEKDLGTECSKLNEFEKAHGHYDEAITFDPTDVSLYANKALVYTKQKLPLKVRELSMMVVAIIMKYGGDNKIVAKSHSRIAKTYLEEKNYETALEYFEKVKELNPCTATSDQIRICKKKIYQQEIMSGDEDVTTSMSETDEIHKFLVEERGRCLATESKFHEALSIVEELEFDENSDLGMNLLTAECYIQLGRENKAQKAIKKVEKLLMKPPMSDVEDVISLAQDFTDNCSPVRALLLLRIAGDMLKQSTLPPDKIVEGIIRCIEEMNDSVQALHDFKKYDAARKLSKMKKAIKIINKPSPKTIAQSRKTITENMDTREGAKRVVLNERSGLIAIDYGVEVMKKMLDDLCFMASECVDPQNIVLKQAILCNVIAANYKNTRQHEKSIRLLTAGLARLKNHFGENVGKLEVYIRTLTNIATEYRNSEKYYEAEQIVLKALAEIDFDNEKEQRIMIKYIEDQLKLTRRHIKAMKILEALPYWLGN